MKDSSSLHLPLESLVALQIRGLLLAPFTYLETITESMVKIIQHHRFSPWAGIWFKTFSGKIGKWTLMNAFDECPPVICCVQCTGERCVSISGQGSDRVGHLMKWGRGDETVPRTWHMRTWWSRWVLHKSYTLWEVRRHPWYPTACHDQNGFSCSFSEFIQELYIKLFFPNGETHFLRPLHCHIWKLSKTGH